MCRERSLAVAAVTAALFVIVGTPASGSHVGSSAGPDPQGFFGPAPVLALELPLNQPPIALDDAYLATMNEVLVVPAPGVLVNDIDPEFKPISASIRNGATVGVEVLGSNGGFTYTPPFNWVGIATFSYCATDGQQCSNVATVTITVIGIPPLPTPTLPLPTPTLPTLPTPTLPLPTPTLPPLATPTLPPGATPTAPPGATPTPTPNTSFEPGPSGSPSPSPTSGGPSTGGGAGPIGPSPAPPTSGVSAPGHQGEVDLAPRSRGAGPVGGPGIGLDGLASNLEWAVPAAVLAFPGLLVLLVGAIQTFGGAAWLPIVRRALRGTGVSRATPGYRYIVRTTE